MLLRYFHCQGKSSYTYIAYLQKIVYNNSVENNINQFEIGYMVNPTLNINTVFRENVDKCFKYTFNSSTMSGMINVMKKKRVLLHQ